MKIHIDNIIFSLQKSGGVSVYWHELIKKMRKHGEFVFYESPNKNIFSNRLDELAVIRESLITARFLRYLPFLKRIKNHSSIFHSSYYRVSLQPNIANVTTVHDFTYELFMNGLPKLIHHKQKKNTILKSDGIICVSNNTLKDMLSFFPCAKEKYTKVIYHGVSDKFKPILSPNIYLNEKFKVLRGKEYLLYIGDRSPYKNFNIAINILKQIDDMYLVLVGGGPLKDDEKNMIGKNKKKIISLEIVTDEDLNFIYNNAFCLLYPSSYEGFGMPILEAMKAGCPVVSTNCSSIPEIAGNAALLVDNIEPSEFLCQIKRLQNNEIRSGLINKGFKQVMKFSWDKCFEETYTFYEEVYRRKFH
jgi:mannosyltransferase